jgi:hypothetical protein
MANYKGWKTKLLLLPATPGALLHEREYVGQNNSRSSCEHERYLKPYETNLLIPL